MPGKPWTPEQREAASQRTRERLAAKKSELDAQEAAPNSPDQPPEPPAPTLIDEERELLRRKAQAVIAEELAAKAKAEREKFLKDELDKEILRQRREAGLTDHRDDMVEFMINVAPFSPGITINGRHFPHGSWVTLSRREYDSIRDIMARSWEAEERAGNPNKKFEEWRRAAGVTNPMLREHRLPDGSFTLGLDYGVRGQNTTGRTSYNA